MEELHQFIYRLNNAEKFFSKYVIEIGVIQSSDRRRNKKSKVNQIASMNLGITNAEILFIQENGSPVNHLPARPVLDRGIRFINKHYTNQVLEKLMKMYVDNEPIHKIEDEMRRFCMRIQSIIRKKLMNNDFHFKKLSPNNARYKKQDDPIPLWDTGNLGRSIVAVLTRNGKYI